MFHATIDIASRVCAGGDYGNTRFLGPVMLLRWVIVLYNPHGDWVLAIPEGGYGCFWWL